MSLSRPNPAVLRTQLSGILRRPGRLMMTGLSVLVAAFVVFGTVLAYQITTRTTLDTFSGTPQATSLVAEVDGATMLTAAQIAAVRAVPGVAEAVGRSDNLMHLGTSKGTYVRVSADPGSGPLSRVTVVDGGYPERTGQIALDLRAAEHLGVPLGGTIALRNQGTDAPPTTVTVTALVDGPAQQYDQAYGPDTVVAALGGADEYLRIDVRAAAGVSPDILRDRIEPLLGPALIRDGAAVRTAEARNSVRQFDEIFALIGMFVSIAVVAAALVATSTFRIVFAQRLRQLALLRTIGAHRGQLVRALAVEGAIVGFAAGTAGVLLALVVGQAVVPIMRAAGQELSAPGVPVPAGLAVILGAVLVTLGAVLAPAFSAARVAPLQALRNAGTNSGERGIGTARLVAGLLLVGGAAAVAVLVLALLPDRGDPTYGAVPALSAVVVSGALAFCGLIALGPVLIRPVLAVAGWPLRRLGPIGSLAVSGVGGTPRRAAAVSVVVALGVTLVAGTTVGTACLQAYVDRGLALSAPADFVVNADDSPFTADAVRRLGERPELAHVSPYRISELTVGDDAAEAVATDLDPAGLPGLDLLRAATGSLDDLGPGRVVLSEALAGSLGRTAGDTLVLTSATGRRTVTVAATLAGKAPLTVAVLAAPADLDALGVPSGPTGVLADAARPGAAARSAARTAIEQVIGTGGGAALIVLADERDDSRDDVNSLFVMAIGLLGLTVLIAVVGVGTTTGLSVLERTAESGLLRALGLSRPGLRRMIGIESGLYGVIGAVLGLLLGVPYAWLSIAVLNLGAPLELPVGRLLVLFAVLTGITALAGLLPARRAARVSPVAALGTVE